MPTSKAKNKPAPKPKEITNAHLHEHLLTIGLQQTEILKQLSIIIKKQNKMATTVQELKDQLTAQGATLDTVATNVTGIQGDVTALKAKIDELNSGGDAAVQAAMAELTPFVDSVGSKIASISQATADLDAQTP